MANCKICGKPSGFYPLCNECNELKEKGLIIKNKNGEWEKIKEDEKSSNSNCIVCGAYTTGKPLCYSCYTEVIERKNEFDKNQNSYELKDYYFNLKSNTYRIKNIEYVKENCKKMFSLSILINDLYEDTSLSDRVINDIKNIIEEKKEKPAPKITKKTEELDSQKSNIIRTSDGHIVKSYGESIIDNMLYNNRLIHSYEKEVIDISSDERTIKSDWFIPASSNKDGIYIEYWGMSTRDYLKNKEEKQRLYKEHDIPVIYIEKDDIKDPGGLENRIIREIKKLNEKYGLGMKI